MEEQKRSLQMGAAVILLAVVLRLLSGAGNLTEDFWASPLPRMILYFETGRLPGPAPDPTVPPATEAPATAPTAPLFEKEDAGLVYLRNFSGREADVAAALEAPLEISLDRAILLHTHATESYTSSPGQDYAESADYRTLDPRYNLIAVGAALEGLLTEGGMEITRDETLHDYPSYNGAYEAARVTAQALLEEWPRALLLDIHRDAALGADGQQVHTAVDSPWGDAAQLLFVIGTDHPAWEQNFRLAVHLTVRLEQLCPGITRGVVLRTYGYNQDLTPGAVLVEVGTAGNSQTEALAATQALARAILDLRQGGK